MDMTERDPVCSAARAERFAGRWSARFVVVISVAYAAIVVAGFASLGNLTDPLPDPYLAVAEVLILIMAPVMVLLMAAVHACAPAHLRMFSLVAFGWMLVAACLTMTVHVVSWWWRAASNPGGARLRAAVRLRMAVDAVRGRYRRVGPAAGAVAGLRRGRVHWSSLPGGAPRAAGQRGALPRRARRPGDRRAGLAGDRDPRLRRGLPGCLRSAEPGVRRAQSRHLHGGM